MKRNYIFSMLLLLFMAAVVQAQKKTNLKFASINQIGVLKGNSDAALQWQTVNGVAYKTFFAGLGVGLDYYYLRTVPVFVDVRKNLSAKTETPFVYAALGAALPWVKNTEPAWQKSDYNKGFYGDVGIGYSMPLKGRFYLDLSVGYSQKSLQETRYNRYYRDFPPYDDVEWHKEADFNYTFRRVSVRLALRF